MTQPAEKTITLDQWQHRLVTTFELIEQTRMQGVPVLNANLEVNADHYILWEGYFLGVLITPWFMNLILAPATEETQQQVCELKVGQKQTHVFPSGPYEFIVGHEAQLTNYLSCSLFSPMFEFADQVAAQDTAQAVLQELMKSENLEILDAGNEQSLHTNDELEPEAEPDNSALDATGDGDPAIAAPPISQRPMSRRQLFLGKRR